jgi:hypothetical protein
MCQPSKAHHTPFQRGTRAARPVTSPKVAQNRYFDLAPRVLVAVEGFWVDHGRTSLLGYCRSLLPGLMLRAAAALT